MLHTRALVLFCPVHALCRRSRSQACISWSRHLVAAGLIRSVTLVPRALVARGRHPKSTGALRVLPISSPRQAQGPCFAISATKSIRRESGLTSGPINICSNVNQEEQGQGQASGFRLRDGRELRGSAYHTERGGNSLGTQFAYIR
jgi:hypothetical protein